MTTPGDLGHSRAVRQGEVRQYVRPYAPSQSLGAIRRGVPRTLPVNSPDRVCRLSIEADCVQIVVVEQTPIVWVCPDAPERIARLEHQGGRSSAVVDAGRQLVHTPLDPVVHDGSAVRPRQLAHHATAILAELSHRGSRSTTNAPKRVCRRASLATRGGVRSRARRIATYENSDSTSSRVGGAGAAALTRMPVPMPRERKIA